MPPARALVLLSFRERFTSFDAVPAILPEPGLSALGFELMRFWSNN